MTREEALQILDTIPTISEQVDALEMAIQALSQEPTDAISREAVCNIVEDIRDCISVDGYCAIIERLKKLPSVSTTKNIVNHGTMNITL